MSAGKNITVIRCSKCQRAYTSLSEFVQVRSIGLALKGLCRCGAWVSCGELWQPVSIKAQQDERKMLANVSNVTKKAQQDERKMFRIVEF
jgi:hypothetical protein